MLMCGIECRGGFIEQQLAAPVVQWIPHLRQYTGELHSLLLPPRKRRVEAAFEGRFQHPPMASPTTSMSLRDSLLETAHE